jgi:hypothetical protein
MSITVSFASVVNQDRNRAPPHGETSVQMLHFPQSRSKDDNLVDVKS